MHWPSFCAGDGAAAGSGGQTLLTRIIILSGFGLIAGVVKRRCRAARRDMENSLCIILGRVSSLVRKMRIGLDCLLMNIGDLETAMPMIV